MRKVSTVSLLSLLPLLLAGCGSMGEKNGTLAPIYGAAATLSFLLLLVCCRAVRKHRVWLIVLFTSVLVVNVGYTLLALSTSLEMALWANRVAYLGSVFLPLSMLLIILRVTNTAYGRRLPCVLVGVAIAVFCIAASPGILDIYYKEVSFAVVNGVARLVKVYGPLHRLYLVYLLGYFAAMVAVILRAASRKTIGSTAHAVVLAMAVMVNIGVWFIEQVTYIEFEMLSLSYIISEMFLLGVHLVLHEAEQLRQLVQQAGTVQPAGDGDITAEEMLVNPVEAAAPDTELLALFLDGVGKLTATERAIYGPYVARATTREIMTNLNITENTLKFHNKNIYGKLGVSSRKELMERYKQLRRISEGK